MEHNVYSYSQVWFITAKDAKHSPQREKAHGVKSREARARLPRGLSWWDAYHPPTPATSCDSTCEMLPTRSFAESWSHGRSLLGMHHNSRLPEGKQVLGTSHIICTNSLSTVSPLLSCEQKELSPKPSFQMPAKGQPCKQAFLSLASQACCALFCTGAVGGYWTATVTLKTMVEKISSE